MTDDKPPTRQQATYSLFQGLVRTAAVVGALIWLFVLFAFLAALGTRSGDGSGMHVLQPLIRLMWTTPIFIFLVVPALIFSFQRHPEGARIGAGFVLGAIAVAAAIYAAPYVVRLFP